MRRAYNNKISILLIIIIAIFTILSYFFDQLVIRNEDKLRNAEISFNNSTQKIIKLNSISSQLQAAYDYSDQKFKVIESTQKNAKYTIVHSKIEESSAQPEIKIDWRVYTKNPQKPLIRDLIVEGLRLAKTQKEEFASILNSNNMDINALLNKLKEFVSS